MLSQADKDKVGLVNWKVNAHIAMSHFFTQQNPFNQVEDQITFLQGVYFPVAYLFPLNQYLWLDKTLCMHAIHLHACV